MAIDLKSDDVFPLTEVPGKIAPIVGRKVRVSTVHRWAKIGFRGVTLDTIKVGATRCTSTESLQKFAAAISA
jgi:Protein of unknown function (DUF1580)